MLYYKYKIKKKGDKKMVTKFTMYVDMENDVLEIDNNDLNYSVIIENCNKVTIHEIFEIFIQETKAMLKEE